MQTHTPTLNPVNAFRYSNAEPETAERGEIL